MHSRLYEVLLGGVKKVLYVDMDNVLVDVKSGIARLEKQTVRWHEGYLRNEGT